MIVSDVLERLSEYKCVGSGVTRLVYDLGDGTVLKLPKEPCHAWANVSEYDNWCSAHAEHEEMFAPIYACADDGSWLIMAKAHHTFDRCSHECTHPTYNDLDVSGAIDFLADNYDVEDMHPCNWGVMPDGTVRAIDYAI